MRKEQQLVQVLSEQENQGKSYEKELELAKFHEEQGKIKCECYSCVESKRIQAEIKEELFKNGKKTEESENEIKSECANCYQYQKVDEESGLCGKCSKL